MKKVAFRYLSQEDILSLNLSTEQIVSSVERVIRSHGEKMVQMPPKPALFPRKGRYSYFHAMPAYVEDLDICGLKWLSRSSHNQAEHGLPQFTGLQIVNDPETGVPLCVMDCRWITVARTTAVSVITAKCMTPDTPKSLSILGTGLQGRFHALMLTSEFPSIERIYVYNRSDEGRDRFLEDMRPRISAEIVPVDGETAVRNGQIVVTAGIMQNMIPLDWITPGTLCIGLDLARAWYPDVITGIDRIFTDDETQFWHRFTTEPEAFSGKPEISGELSSVLLGRIPGRLFPEERILSLNLGMAICDLALGDLIYREAEKQGVGVVLPLMEKDSLLP
ncbi:MAG: ornithine cyclodeaminase family protein [Synergistaceae bacterium]|nr:ornithine cyclodeaminase family protein [Synergistaceae bacterium]